MLLNPNIYYYYKGTYNTEESKEIRKLYFSTLLEPFSSKIIKSWDEAKIVDYVHLGGTKMLIKTCFREGIDTPIELYLADDRIIKPIEKSITTAIKGNLIYQKFKFIISVNYSVAIIDKNIDKSF